MDGYRELISTRSGGRGCVFVRRAPAPFFSRGFPGSFACVSCCGRAREFASHSHLMEFPAREPPSFGMLRVRRRWRAQGDARTPFSFEEPLKKRVKGF